MAASDPNLYAFELTFKALYDSKTPISRSKIQAITETALKAQKFYKHVVMHIETFIRKSSPKHKLPGIYVIDAILRLSRRGPGKDRDIFVTRFAKNLPTTFTNAIKCTDEDRSKVLRCFKLWKEANFFPVDIIEPITTKIEAIESFKDTDSKNQLDERAKSASPAAREISQERPARKDSPAAEKAEKPRFDKRLLDFDYSDDDEEQKSKRNKTRSITNDEEQEDFFTMGKDGKPEFAVDKIMMGLRQSRGLSLHDSASSVAATAEAADDTNLSVDTPMSLQSEPETATTAAVEQKAVSTRIVLRSSTIWVGHLPKSVTENELKKEFNRHGTVKSVDIIPSRGCAYISFEKRRHAESAISTHSLHDLWDIFGEKVKVSWSPGKGIKDGYKKWDWDPLAGVCRIRFDLVPTNVKELQEGSELDESSIPQFMKATFLAKTEEPKPVVEEVAPLPVVSLTKPSSWARPVNMANPPPTSWQQGEPEVGLPIGLVNPRSLQNPAQSDPHAFNPSLPPPFFNNNQGQPPNGLPIGLAGIKPPTNFPTSWSDPVANNNNVQQQPDPLAQVLNSLKHYGGNNQINSNNFRPQFNPQQGNFPPPLIPSAADISSVMQMNNMNVRLPIMNARFGMFPPQQQQRPPFPGQNFPGGPRFGENRPRFHNDGEWQNRPPLPPLQNGFQGNRNDEWRNDNRERRDDFSRAGPRRSSPNFRAGMSNNNGGERRFEQPRNNNFHRMEQPKNGDSNGGAPPPPQNFNRDGGAKPKRNFVSKFN